MGSIEIVGEVLQRPDMTPITTVPTDAVVKHKSFLARASIFESSGVSWNKKPTLGVIKIRSQTKLFQHISGAILEDDWHSEAPPVAEVVHHPEWKKWNVMVNALHSVLARTAHNVRVNLDRADDADEK